MDLTNVTVTDPMLGGLLNVTDLGIGSNETLYGNYTVTQADMNNNGSGTASPLTMQLSTVISWVRKCYCYSTDKSRTRIALL